MNNENNENKGNTMNTCQNIIQRIENVLFDFAEKTDELNAKIWFCASTKPGCFWAFEKCPRGNKGKFVAVARSEIFNGRSPCEQSIYFAAIRVSQFLATR